MFSILALGIALWIVYGVLQSDVVITTANTVSLALLSGILYFKLRPKQFRNSRSAFTFQLYGRPRTDEKENS